MKPLIWSIRKKRVKKCFKPPREPFTLSLFILFFTSFITHFTWLPAYFLQMTACVYWKKWELSSPLISLQMIEIHCHHFVYIKAKKKHEKEEIWLNLDSDLTTIAMSDKNKKFPFFLFFKHSTKNLIQCSYEICMWPNNSTSIIYLSLST